MQESNYLTQDENYLTFAWCNSQIEITQLHGRRSQIESKARVQITNARVQSPTITII